MITADINAAAEWSAAACFSFIALCLLIGFAIYRKTGGQWPDYSKETESSRCPYCNARMASHSRADVMECAALRHGILNQTEEVPSDRDPGGTPG